MYPILHFYRKFIGGVIVEEGISGEDGVQGEMLAARARDRFPMS